MSIGVSNNPLHRENHYARSGVYKSRSSFNPPIKLENQILYRSNNRLNCLKVEYLLQLHLSERLWQGYFKQFMNVQKKVKPLQSNRQNEATFVYEQFTTAPFNFANKN